MTYAGGNFTDQDKDLPGVFINFTSKGRSDERASTRGVCAIGLSMDWGESGKIIEIDSDVFVPNAKSTFGYDAGADVPNMRIMREIFKNARKLYLYRLNKGGVSATCTYATAKWFGTRGNALSLLIQANVDVSSSFDVTTYLGDDVVDKQVGVTNATIKPNAFVTFKNAPLVASATKVVLTGGTDGNAVAIADYTAFLNVLSAYRINTIINGVPMLGSDNLNALYGNWAISQRNDMGNKLQAVLYNYDGDNEAIVNVYNSADAVYWVGGALAACELNSSVQGKEYDGEFILKGDYTPSELVAASKAGKFCLQNDNWKLRVLDDINSLITFTPEKNREFRYNQTIRVLDSMANEIKDLFVANYLGKIPNNDNGRVAFKSDIITLLNRLKGDVAITSFDKSKLTVTQGKTIREVVVYAALTPSNCMSQVYMTVLVG